MRARLILELCIATKARGDNLNLHPFQHRLCKNNCSCPILQKIEFFAIFIVKELNYAILRPTAFKHVIEAPSPTGPLLRPWVSKFALKVLQRKAVNIKSCNFGGVSQKSS